jgi:hypothetical protein
MNGKSDRLNHFRMLASLLSWANKNTIEDYFEIRLKNEGKWQCRESLIGKAQSKSVSSK